MGEQSEILSALSEQRRTDNLLAEAISKSSGTTNGNKAITSALVSLAGIVVIGLAGYTTVAGRQSERDFVNLKELLLQRVSALEQLHVEHRTSGGHPELVALMSAFDVKVQNFNGVKSDVSALMERVFGVGVELKGP